MRTLILLISLFCSSLWANTITDNNNLSCSLQSRCAIQSTNQKIKPTFVHFSEKTQSGKKTIFAVHFKYPQGGGQVDSIKGMESVNIDDPYHFRYVDLDGDSHKDIALRMTTGTNINHFHYWRYSPKTGKYVSLGKHEEVHFDPHSKKLQSARRHHREKTTHFELSEEEIRPVSR